MTIRMKACKGWRFLGGVFLLAAAFWPWLAPAQAQERSDMEVASHIARMLGQGFHPESVEVTVKDSRAYAVMRGATLSKIRIDTMRLDALLTHLDAPLDGNDVKSLSKLIGYSKGELVLLERDVNAYFDANETRGFSKLVFDFKPTGFRADGVFTAEFLFTLRIRLAATGVLALHTDGVYLDDVAIFVEKVKQPAALTRQIVERVNPLIEWSDIPFKVEFKKITMDEDAARMTGYPEPFEDGARAEWTR